MLDITIDRLKHSLAFLFSKRVDLLGLLADNVQRVSNHKDRISFDVSGLRRGLHYISIKYEATPPLIGPRICWGKDECEGDSDVFIFESRSGAEIFGTVQIGSNVHTLHFYPSRLESVIALTEVTIRPITGFSREWRYGVGFVQSKTFGYKWLVSRYLTVLSDRIFGKAGHRVSGSYAVWWERYGRCGKSQLREQRSLQSHLANRPKFSIVMPTYKPNLDYLQEAVESVAKQSYENWQLCICDDASDDPELTAYLERTMALDTRVVFTTRKKNGHISAASNDCITLADGDYVGFLDHDDILAPNALFEYAMELSADRKLRLLYSDEDVVDGAGRPLNGHFKPDWNFDLARSINYLCHFLVIESGLLGEIGGLRQGFEGAQDFDLLLRAYERLARDEVKHLPLVLYHWRAGEGSTAASIDNKPYAAQAGISALADHLHREKISAVAEHSEIPTAYRIRYLLPDSIPSVSVIVPTRNELRVLRNCIDSLLEVTDYSNYEVLVIDNDSDDPNTLEYLAELNKIGNVHVLNYAGPFNYSAINNYAVSNVTADVLLLLNNDTEIINSDWMSEMVSHALRPTVGAVGAKLLYANNRIQHAGIILGLGGDGIAGHAFKGRHKDEVGSLARTRLVQEYSAVTGACLAVLREKYLEVGGFDAENLHVAYNDVDFCLRLEEAGYRNVWTPYAQLYHYESYSRGPDTLEVNVTRYGEEARYMKLRWSGKLENDRNYNPNLSRGLRSFELAWPPYPIERAAGA